MKYTIIVLMFVTSAVLCQGSWVEQVSGVSVSLNSAVTSNWVNNAWVCGDNGTVLKTTNLGTNWVNVSGNGIPSNINLNVIAFSYLNNAGAFVSGVKNDTAIVYRTSNNGTNWNVVFRQYNTRILGMKINNQVGFLVANPIGGRWSVWKTTNEGVTWDSAGLFIPQNNNETGWNNSFSFNNQNIFFGTNNSRLYISTNSGLNWSFKTFTNLQSITALVLSPFEGYISGPGRIFFTHNNGINWTSDSLMPGSGNVVGIVNQPLPVDLLGYYNLYITRGDNRIFYLGASGGNWLLSYTAPSGNYNHISNGMPWDYFAVRDNGGISYCSCHLITVEENENEIPMEYSLSQNYPNPFNPVTNIKFEISGQSVAQTFLSVYDILG
ncbi:MAG: hypothetical protein IAE90_16255, partial [Ignavibacteria bacterium]|nr:hypothetical protein [Ignavibacteria bacterium]